MEGCQFFFLLLFSPLIVPFSFRLLFTDIPQTWNTDLPQTGNIKEIKRFLLPSAETTGKVVYASEFYFNIFPEHAIYQAFPVCLLEYQTHAYLGSLRKLKPGNHLSIQ